MKKSIPPVFIALISLVTGPVPPRGPAALQAQEQNERYNGVIAHAAERAFIAGPITRAQLTQILHAGSRAPSANNRQPWYFTVVQTLEMGKRVLPDFQDGNVLIIVSTFGDGKTNGADILDCGLAVENLYLAAQALGLGSRIYTGPMDTINSTLKEALNLPNGHSAVALVRVGHVNSGPDAVTAASSRKNLNSIVGYK